jgi:hypothetical protein
MRLKIDLKKILVGYGLINDIKDYHIHIWPSSNSSFSTFWYFWLTIQNITNRHVRNAFGLIAVFISFSLARCCALPPTPLPFFGGGKVLKQKKIENRLRR